jgi:hypothetical protein
LSYLNSFHCVFYMVLFYMSRYNGNGLNKGHFWPMNKRKSLSEWLNNFLTEKKKNEERNDDIIYIQESLIKRGKIRFPKLENIFSLSTKVLSHSCAKSLAGRLARFEKKIARNYFLGKFSANFCSTDIKDNYYPAVFFTVLNCRIIQGNFTSNFMKYREVKILWQRTKKIGFVWKQTFLFWVEDYVCRYLTFIRK